MHLNGEKWRNVIFWLKNHDPGMTLTYFMSRSTLVAYARSQVSVYRTIGPLVRIYHGT